MADAIRGRNAMIITIGKVNAFIIPEIKYATLYEKTTNAYLYEINETTYDRLLNRVFRCSLIFNQVLRAL